MSIYKANRKGIVIQMVWEARHNFWRDVQHKKTILANTVQRECFLFFVIAKQNEKNKHF